MRSLRRGRRGKREHRAWQRLVRVFNRLGQFRGRKSEEFKSCRFQAASTYSSEPQAPQPGGKEPRRAGRARDPGDGTQSGNGSKHLEKIVESRCFCSFLLPTTKDHLFREVVYFKTEPLFSPLAHIRMSDPSSRGKAWPMAPALLNNQVCLFDHSSLPPWAGYWTIFAFSCFTLSGSDFGAC